MTCIVLLPTFSFKHRKVIDVISIDFEEYRLVADTRSPPPWPRPFRFLNPFFRSPCIITKLSEFRKDVV